MLYDKLKIIQKAAYILFICPDTKERTLQKRV